YVACPTAPTVPGDRRADTTQLKYTTFNTEFLMLHGFGSSPKCPGASCSWSNLTEADKHLDQIAKVIVQLDSDMLQLNEVEDCFVLQTLIKKIEALGDFTYKPYLVRGTDTATSQNAALLTRVDPSVDLKRTEVTAAIPVSNSTCPVVSGIGSKKGVSKHFYTTFNLPGFDKPVTVIGAHLLANPQDGVRCFDREAQATVLAGLADAALLRGEDVILSGDLNDFSKVVPDRNANKPISNVLAILAGSSMVETASFVPQESRYSEWWDQNADCVYTTAEVSSLDHILISKGLAPRVASVKFNNDLYSGVCGSYNSDHFPVTITLKAGA
ncbi:hypothetical protein Gpo141_00014796, partial [Globisporangium polare]